MALQPEQGELIELSGGDAETATAAELGRRLALATSIPLDDGHVARVLRQDERIEFHDAESLLSAPRRCRGSVTIYEPNDFVSYVERLGNDHTTLWADPDAGTVTAVFDDHADPLSPGWRRHRAVLSLRPDDDWKAWVTTSGRLMSQEQFAEFIQDNLAVIVDPDGATMLEVASSFQARRNSSFERGTRLQTGDVQLRWVENTTATAGTKGHLEVPEQFTVRLAPFLGVEPVELVARLRYRIADGQLRIGYQLHRPDIASREAFDRIRAVVATGGTHPIHLGEAPPSLHTAKASDGGRLAASISSTISSAHTHGTYR